MNQMGIENIVAGTLNGINAFFDNYINTRSVLGACVGLAAAAIGIYAMTRVERTKQKGKPLPAEVSKERYEGLYISDAAKREIAMEIMPGFKGVKMQHYYGPQWLDQPDLLELYNIKAKDSTRKT